MEISGIRKRGLVHSERLFGLIVVVRVSGGNMILILGASLCFATITLLAEGEIEIVAHDTDPVLGFVVRVGLSRFLESFFDWG